MTIIAIPDQREGKDYQFVASEYQSIREHVTFVLRIAYICMMIRTILKPTKNDLTLRLPDNLIGKLVEVIAFEIDEPTDIEKADIDKSTRISEISRRLDKHRADLSDFKFSRDEANDYE